METPTLLPPEVVRSWIRLFVEELAAVLSESRVETAEEKILKKATGDLNTVKELATLTGLSYNTYLRTKLASMAEDGKLQRVGNRYRKSPGAPEHRR